MSGFSPVFVPDACKRSGTRTCRPQSPKALSGSPSSTVHLSRTKGNARSPRETVLQSGPTGPRRNVMACQRKSAALIGTSPRAQQPSSSSSSVCAARPNNKLVVQDQTSPGKVETANTLQKVAAALQAAQHSSSNYTSTASESSASRSSRLAMARAAKKVEVDAVDRSELFTLSLYGKLEDLRDSVSSCSTSCGSRTPQEATSPDYTRTSLSFMLRAS